MSHLPSQSSRIPSSRGMLCRDPGLPHFSRNSMNASGNVFEKVYLLKKGYLRRYPVIQRRMWQIHLAKVYQELP